MRDDTITTEQVNNLLRLTLAGLLPANSAIAVSLKRNIVEMQEIVRLWDTYTRELVDEVDRLKKLSKNSATKIETLSQTDLFRK